MRTIDEKVWLKNEAKISTPVILDHISPPDGIPGSVIAAMTGDKPNYRYHWVRDAGIVMESLAQTYAQSTGEERRALLKKFKDYVAFSAAIQDVPTLSGLGEPKYNIDGTAFNDPWGRPQDDGNGDRVNSMTAWAKALALEDDEFVKERILPVVRRDLAYTKERWRKPSFDLWEEEFGDHFYTRMVQRRALLEGARLLAAHGEDDLAATYKREGEILEATIIPTFWDAAKGCFVATRNASPGMVSKPSGLDISVILGLRHGKMDDAFLPANDARVQKTVAKLVDVFRDLYPINRRLGFRGVAIGRYPEDMFSGPDRSGGNPWVLTTLVMAQNQYDAARLERRSGNLDRAREYSAQADDFVARVQTHANPDGTLSEQINRHTGFMTSVSVLTWNYAEILNTERALALSLRP